MFSFCAPSFSILVSEHGRSSKKVGDKTLKDIEFEDLNKIDMSELETAREGTMPISANSFFENDDKEIVLNCNIGNVL